MRQVHGIYISTPPSDMEGAYESSNMGLLVLGGGRKVWEDYETAKGLFDGPQDYEIMCINDIAGQFKAETIEHIVSCHGELCGAFRTVRHEKSMLEHTWTHSDQKKAGVDRHWGINTCGGTSSMLAVKIAVVMGYKKIILCGIPFDDNGHYFDPPEKEKNRSTTFGDDTRFQIWKEFLRDCQISKDRVRALNSRLTELYGEPTREWTHGG